MCDSVLTVLTWLQNKFNLSFHSHCHLFTFLQKPWTLLFLRPRSNPLLPFLQVHDPGNSPSIMHIWNLPVPFLQMTLMNFQYQNCTLRYSEANKLPSSGLLSPLPFRRSAFLAPAARSWPHGLGSSQLQLALASQPGGNSERFRLSWRDTTWPYLVWHT